MHDKDVDNMREAMGTLPSRSPEKSYEIKNAITSINVKLVATHENPYKALVAMAAATWGTGKSEYGEGSTGKWAKLTPENRYEVVRAVLTGNTLPTALEAVNFTFEVNGTPRHTFDQFARARIGIGFGSIGSRDNNKLDAPFVLYDELLSDLENDPDLMAAFVEWTRQTKDLYERLMGTNQGSWQTARAVLPMCYNHSFVFNANLMAIRGQCGRRLMACEEGPMCALMWRIVQEVGRKFPLLAVGMKPVCDRAKRCVYHEGPEGMTKYFSALFAGCGRWPTDEDYSEFNHSCTSYERLKELGVPVATVEEIVNFEKCMLGGYDNLMAQDRMLFEEA